MSQINVTKKELGQFNNWIVENKVILDRINAHIQEFDPCLLDLTDINDVYYYFYTHTSSSKK